LLLALFLSQAGLMRGAGLKPEELVARHLDSLGTPAARAAVKSRVVQGTVRFKILVGGGGWLEGQGAVVSEERKVDILLKFHTDYQGEQFISDGNKSYIAATRADHRRTSFGEFVKSQSVMLQEGLLGGALSTGWTLLNLDHANPKLSYGGLKKVDGRQLMVLHYESTKGNDMNIRLYFDPETYQHVMTVYELTASAGLGALSNRPGAEPTQSSRQKDIRYTLEERFSNFITTDGITLPTHYNIHFIEELQSGQTGFYEWDMSVSDVQDNLTLDPRNFQVR